MCNAELTGWELTPLVLITAINTSKPTACSYCLSQMANRQKQDYTEEKREVLMTLDH